MKAFSAVFATVGGLIGSLFDGAWQVLSVKNMYGFGMIFMGVAMIDAPDSGVAGFMRSNGFPIRIYALLLVMCGAILISRREQLIFAICLTPLLGYVFFSVAYFTSPTLPPHTTTVPLVLYTTTYFAAMSYGLRARVSDKRAQDATQVEFEAIQLKLQKQLSDLRTDIAQIHVREFAFLPEVAKAPMPDMNVSVAGKADANHG